MVYPGNIFVSKVIYNAVILQWIPGHKQADLLAKKGIIILQTRVGPVLFAITVLTETMNKYRTYFLAFTVRYPNLRDLFL